MKLAEMRECSVEKLQNTLMDLLRERFDLRMAKSQGSITKNHVFRINRQAVARVKTIMTQKERSEVKS